MHLVCIGCFKSSHCYSIRNFDDLVGRARPLLKLIDEHPSLAHHVIGELAGKAQYLIRMAEKGMIRVERHQIQILNKDGLKLK